MSKVFMNPVPHADAGVRVVVLAAPGHGETTLVRALAERCRRRYPARAAAPFAADAPAYATPRRRYAHAPARDLLDAGPIDVGLLAVAADVGVTRAAELQVRLARWLGVP